MVAAARCIDRVLEDPQPVCQLKNFGDNSIEMELRFWIRDSENGIANVSSAVRMVIWNDFKANGIEIPFPQRVVHMIGQPAGQIIKGDSNPSDSFRLPPNPLGGCESSEFYENLRS